MTELRLGLCINFTPCSNVSRPFEISDSRQSNVVLSVETAKGMAIDESLALQSEFETSAASSGIVMIVGRVSTS